MEYMVVTLEVSKLSGWLNADPVCRESEGRHTVRGEVYQSAGGRWRTTAVHAAYGEGLDCSLEAHPYVSIEHDLHVCDAGGVEAQRLVERRR
eukprot:scaffold54948_cov49-Phaeocystis_antarctica.AAC.3